MKSSKKCVREKLSTKQLKQYRGFKFSHKSFGFSNFPTTYLQLFQRVETHHKIMIYFVPIVNLHKFLCVVILHFLHAISALTKSTDYIFKNPSHEPVTVTISLVG
jgi:hypothetical protein